jgi:hypothetical protein
MTSDEIALALAAGELAADAGRRATKILDDGQAMLDAIDKRFSRQAEAVLAELARLDNSDPAPSAGQRTEPGITPPALPKPKDPPPQPGEIVSEDRAARVLPWRRRDAVAWLRREGLSVEADGRRVVVWEAVLARLAGGASTPTPSRRPRRRAPSGDLPLLAPPGRMFG